MSLEHRHVAEVTWPRLQNRTHDVLVDQIVAAGERILDRPEAVDFALFEREQHARGRDVARDQLDRITLSGKQRRHHGGRRRRPKVPNVSGLAEDFNAPQGFRRRSLCAHKAPSSPARTTDKVSLSTSKATPGPLSAPSTYQERPGIARSGHRRPRAYRHSSSPQGRRRLPCSVRRHRLARDEPHQMPRDDTRRVVDAAARRKSDDHCQRLALIEVARRALSPMPAVSSNTGNGSQQHNCRAFALSSASRLPRSSNPALWRGEP